MLFAITLSLLLSNVHSVGVNKDAKLRLIIPLPIELPNRNDRADQCWLRIEDTELIETLTVYCHIAQAFLRNYIHDYNNKKMVEDDVDVSLWSELPRTEDKYTVPNPLIDNDKVIKDWKVTTVKDPTTRMRLYVSQKAECSLIMYSRESLTNYNVDCERILYFVNEKMTNSAVFPHSQFCLIVICFFLLYFGW